MDQRKYGTDYVEHFDPEAFLNLVYSGISGSTSEGDFLKKVLTDFHDVYATGNIRGKRLLDIGSGPTIHTLISVSPYCEAMYMSDIAPQNLCALKRWLDSEQTHSFHKIIEFVLQLENNGETIAEREKAMRDKVSGIFPLDLVQDEPFRGVLLPQFDIVTSSLCLEAVAHDVTEYETIARRISKMVKTNGHVVLFGVLGETFYKVGDVLFYSLPLKAGEVKQAWEKCGFRLTSWKETSNNGEFKNASDFQSYFLMTAQKL